MDSFYGRRVVDASSSSSDEDESKTKKPFWKKYRWHMRHYFYIHILIFITNGLLGGLAVVLIETYLRPNRFIRIRFIDTWFVASSCVYCCGLVSIDFARLSTLSQVVLMLLTLASGITVSALPALIIKSRTHKREQGLRVDDDHSAYHLPATLDKNQASSSAAQVKIDQLPNAEQLRYRAYLSCLALIPTTCITIYLISYVTIGGWIQLRYRPSQLKQDGRPVSPWFASFIITVTGFNQNGLTPWSDNLTRFVDDIVLNILVMLVSLDLKFKRKETIKYLCTLSFSHLVSYEWQFIFSIYIS